jgi:hypothetical protein
MTGLLTHRWSSSEGGFRLCQLTKSMDPAPKQTEMPLGGATGSGSCQNTSSRHACNVDAVNEESQLIELLWASQVISEEHTVPQADRLDL